ncbi:hypothetical protein [Pseudolysinimonas sp.]|uniref:hypothetical protein n=1 Tax=Pseudolysinimonas sp. TaxID=2680009 RepID=UPI003F81C41A
MTFLDADGAPASGLGLRYLAGAQFVVDEAFRRLGEGRPGPAPHPGPTLRGPGSRP